MYWLLYTILAVVLVAGLYVNLVGAPGLWVMIFATLCYGWVTRWAYLGWKTLVAITVMAGVAELIEFLAAGAGAKKAGASRRGLWGAIIGSIVGAIAFTGIIPIPIVGTIFGVCLGTFLGAILGEVLGGTEVGDSMMIGVGAAKGRLLGIFVKLLFGCLILATVLLVGHPPVFGRSKSNAPPALPASRPVTVPATSRGA